MFLVCVTPHICVVSSLDTERQWLRQWIEVDFNSRQITLTGVKSLKVSEELQGVRGGDVIMSGGQMSYASRLCCHTGLPEERHEAKRIRKRVRREV